MLIPSDADMSQFNLVVRFNPERRYARLVIGKEIVQLSELGKRSFRNYTSKKDHIGQEVGVPFFDY